MHLPICDFPGEVMAKMAGKYGRGQYKLRAHSELAPLIEHVRDRDGFILVVPASRALLFMDDEQLEAEPDDMQFDPDVNLSRILEHVIEYKKVSKGKPIKGIAVVVTKYDTIKNFALSEGMDLYDETGAGFQNFMSTCFPATYNKLNFFGVENVRFFPSEVGLHEDAWGPKDKRINVIRKREDDTPCRVPEYPEESYKNLINYLREFAA
jgi:hypothetical protein